MGNMFCMLWMKKLLIHVYLNWCFELYSFSVLEIFNYLYCMYYLFYCPIQDMVKWNYQASQWDQSHYIRISDICAICSGTKTSLYDWLHMASAEVIHNPFFGNSFDVTGLKFAVPQDLNWSNSSWVNSQQYVFSMLQSCQELKFHSRLILSCCKSGIDKNTYCFSSESFTLSYIRKRKEELGVET